METLTTLGELLEAIDTLDPELTLFAPASRPLSAGSPGLVAAEGDEPVQGVADKELGHLLEVELAREAIEVWSAWRNGQAPTREERVAAVIFYADYDTYLPAEPAESSAGSMNSEWFFVRRLRVAEQRPGERFEVQLRDHAGRAVADARYDTESSLKLDDVIVSEAVLDAGRALTEESGDYVDRQGIHRAPF